MLWEYIMILFAVAIFSTHHSFSKNTQDVGSVFYLLFGAITWFAFGISLLHIDFLWTDAPVAVQHSFTPSDESMFIYLFFGLGITMFVIGLVRSISLVYGPVVEKSSYMTGETLQPWQRQ